MGKKHKRVPLWILKDELIKDFEKWCEERKADTSDPRDMIEFLLQKGFLQGKKWLDYIDGIEYTIKYMMEGRIKHMLLMEGYYPQECYIGPREKERME